MKQKKAIDYYYSLNQEFIVTKSGMSKYRTLRAHLLPTFANEQRYIYDIIVNKNATDTQRSRKLEKIRQIKMQLGALSEEECKNYNDEITRDMHFINNPLYYSDLQDLFLDINFKHFLTTNYNAAFIPSKEEIKSFSEIPENEDDIFLCEIEIETDRLQIDCKLEKAIKENQIERSKHIETESLLDKYEEPLHLENLGATDEFYEGKEGKIRRHKISVAPLNNSQSGELPSICLIKSLNSSPLREQKQKVTILPPLPQYFVLHKEAYKQFPLRNVIS